MTGPVTGLPERRRLLLGRDATFNGVDYAEAGQGRLEVHFINRVRVRGSLAGDRPPVTLTASGAVAEPVLGRIDEDADWFTDTSGRPVLRVTADLADAPARYLLTVHSDRLDPCLRSAAITVPGRGDFADCGEPGPAGRPLSAPPVPIGYLAKDYASFVQALSGYAAARYPAWAERSEADFGVMLMELLSALADELSYLQDRVAAEAELGTATQRLSLVRHARMVDYEPRPAMAAATVIQFDVTPQAAGGQSALPEVIAVQALGGQAAAVDFIAGTPVTAPGPQPSLDPRWNRYQDRAGRVPQLVPYRWDPDLAVLPRGATSLWVDGHGHGFYPGQDLLIDTAGAAGTPPSREIVRLTGAEEQADPVRERQVTLIRWSDGLAGDHDLTRTELAGNLLPALQGRRVDEVFAIPGEGAPRGVPLATARADHLGGPVHYRYSLTRPLAWQSVPAADGGPARSRPVLTVHEVVVAGPSEGEPAGGRWVDNVLVVGERTEWQWVPRLLDADGTAPACTITPERYSAIPRVAGEYFADYDGDGATVRFGDGTFGRSPVPGTTFRVRYLAGGGTEGNVAADTITSVMPGDPATGLVWRCTNPFPVTDGAGQETDAQIRDRAPQQLSSGLLTLTGPADYQEAALSFARPGHRFPFARPDADDAGWVRQAVAAERWTGSWLATTTLVDPVADEPAAAERAALASLAGLLAVRRLAGTDTSVAIARYHWLDLRIACATRPGHRPGAVEAAVLARLDPRPGPGGTTGFFGRDRWTFGQPLEASALLAAVQSCPGVAGVTHVEYRWASDPGEWRPLRSVIGVPSGAILRIDNDRDRPGHGLLFATAQVPR